MQPSPPCHGGLCHSQTVSRNKPSLSLLYHVFCHGDENSKDCPFLVKFSFPDAERVREHSGLEIGTAGDVMTWACNCNTELEDWEVKASPHFVIASLPARHLRGVLVAKEIKLEQQIQPGMF